MKVLTDVSEFPGGRHPVAIALGVFDGVHLGHRAVLNRTMESSKAYGGATWVVTFEPHPLKVLRPNSAPPLLTSGQHKLRLLESIGVDGCIVMDFTADFAALTPERFVEILRTSIPELRAVFVGGDWRFGKDGSGDVDLLVKLAGAAGVSVETVGAVMWNEKVISSSRIRESVAQGDLDDAAAMLGRPFSILGTVTRGHSVGRRLGYPTANLDPHSEVHPPAGVYVVDAALDGEMRRGVMNIGVRPTFGTNPDDSPALELHLPGLEGSLYDLDIEVAFCQWLRDERKFDSADDLKKQIALDIEQAIRCE